MRILCVLFFILIGSINAEKKHVVLVAGTHHYTPQTTLLEFSKKLELAGYSTEVISTEWDPEKDERGLPGLEALKKADVAILFLRFLKIDDLQLKPLMDYVKSGKPVLAMRTTSHAFYYPEGHEQEKLNHGFGLDIMGTKFFLHMKGTADNTLKLKEHPIVADSKDKFKSYGTLYRVDIPKSAKVITEGYTKTKPRVHNNIFGEHIIKAEEFAPTLWTWNNKFGGKTVGTTFGHKKDFLDDNITQILINSVNWLSQK
ncbi:MAG: ThuA domain-containing protein [Lentisphaerales bacterium]|nr:ThuA domain-containing protein [Lentisphaerales bacterium]